MSQSQGSTWNLSAAKIITPEELRRILEVAKKESERDWTFFVIAAHTGLRVSEVGHLMQDDIKDGHLIVIRRKKKRLEPTEMQVSGSILTIIKAWATKQPEGFIFPGRCKPCEIQRMKKGPDGKMVKASLEQFCVGGHASLRDVQRAWKVATKVAGLDQYGRGIHTLRHYAITEFYKRTKDLRAAQVFAAHSSSTMTERYSHVTNLKEYVDGMELVL